MAISFVLLLLVAKALWCACSCPDLRKAFSVESFGVTTELLLSMMPMAGASC